MIIILPSVLYGDFVTYFIGPFGRLQICPSDVPKALWKGIGKINAKGSFTRRLS